MASLLDDVIVDLAATARRLLSPTSPARGGRKIEGSGALKLPKLLIFQAKGTILLALT
jgi:hypothetical protein